jgi:hypothetical protein
MRSQSRVHALDKLLDPGEGTRAGRDRLRFSFIPRHDRRVMQAFRSRMRHYPSVVQQDLSSGTHDQRVLRPVLANGRRDLRVRTLDRDVHAQDRVGVLHARPERSQDLEVERQCLLVG